MFRTEKFFREEKGSIAVLAAFALPVLALAIGGAMDYRHVLRAKTKLQAATDSALLATLAHMRANDHVSNAKLRDFFNRSLRTSLGKKLFYHVSLGQTQMRVDRNKMKIAVKVDAQVRTSFLKMVTINAINTPVVAAGTAKTSYTEVALVLDVTGSMRGSKLRELKRAATNFLNTLQNRARRDGNRDNIHVAIVPFAKYVNVGTQYRNAPWIAVDRDRNIRRCTWRWPSRWNCYSMQVRWQGCVGSRNYPYNIKDGGYTLRKVQGVMTYRRRKGYSESHWNAYVKSRPNYCPSTPIQPLTSLKYRKQSLINTIDSLTASGWTSIPTGLVWGWRVLTHTDPFPQGAPPAMVKVRNVRKVIVLMTDGANTAAPARSYYLYREHVHGTRSAARYANQLTRQLCNNIKAINPATGRRNADIITITFDVRNNTIKQLMRECATLGSHDVKSGQLVKIFERIAGKLAELHLTQ